MSQSVESYSRDEPEINKNMKSHSFVEAKPDNSEKMSSSSMNESIESDCIFDYLFDKEDEAYEEYEAMCKYDDGPRDDYYDDRYD